MSKFLLNWKYFLFFLSLTFAYPPLFSQVNHLNQNLDSFIDIGNLKQLFIDDKIVEASSSIEYVMNSPYQTGEVILESDLPYEKDGFVYLYSSILKDSDEKIKIWYDFYKPRSDDIYDHDRHVAYAESRDGINFSKPDIGLYEYNGSKENNIVISGVIGGSSVWIDPKAPPEHKFKTQAKVYPSGEFHMHSSPDGINWQLYAKIDPKGPHDTQNIIFWDEELEKYLFFGRHRLERNKSEERGVRRAEIKNFREIENIGLSIWPDTKDKNKYSDIAQNGNSVDYYGATIFKYEGLYIMLAQAFWHWNPNIPFQGTEAPGMRDIRLAASRNSIDFTRVGERKAFMTPGQLGRFDSKQIWVIPNPVIMDDEIWIYYVGINWDRAGRIDPLAPGGQKRAAIGRAIMRLDGFISADAPYDSEGELTTKQIKFSGDQLVINANTGAGGGMRVEILDENGIPIPGFSKEECNWIVGNSVRHPVSWNGKGRLQDLIGKVVRIKFSMRDSKLYAFQFK